MSRKFIILDLETAPIPEKAFLNAEPFDPSSVKLGNVKDPDKVAAKIVEAEKAHWKAIVDKACLNADACHIRAAGISMMSDEGIMPVRLMAHKGYMPVDTPEWRKFYPDQDELFMKTPEDYATAAAEHFEMLDSETDLLKELVDVFHDSMVRDHRIIGHYVKTFDIPMTLRRCWANALDPEIDPFGADDFFGRGVCDLADAWKIFRYNKQPDFISLDRLLRILNKPGKEGDGSMFHQTFLTDPAKAASYLTRDITGVYDAACGMFIVHPNTQTK